MRKIRENVKNHPVNREYDTINKINRYQYNIQEIRV